MKAELKTDWTVGKLIKMSEQKAISINHEYQRGDAWKPHQMRMLIDSVMRGYNMPLIYLRRIVGGGSERFEIIDGQQRIKALCYFKEGFYKYQEFNDGSLVQIKKKFPPLYNPNGDGGTMKLPQSVQRKKISWSEKTFADFDDEERRKFEGQSVPVFVVECEEDTARDLFIRLQGGRALTSQEVRDAWPGKFNELVLKIGGKPQLNEPNNSDYNGHEFFRQLMGMKSEKKSEARQLAAQMLMQFLLRKEEGRLYFDNINSDGIDQFYAARVGMDINSDNVAKFKDILDNLPIIFHGKKLDKKNWIPIHLVLFVDMLRGDFDSVWEKWLVRAYDDFVGRVDKVKEFGGRKSPPSQEELAKLMDENGMQFWNFYQMTKSAVDNAETIKQRHIIYVRQMLMLLGKNAKMEARGNPLESRGFLEAIAHLDNWTCCRCENPVAWKDAVINRVEGKRHDKFSCPYLRDYALAHQVCPDSGE